MQIKGFAIELNMELNVQYFISSNETFSVWKKPQLKTFSWIKYFESWKLPIYVTIW